MLELSKSELLFRQFAENIKEVFWRTNSSMDKFFYVSPSYEEIWGSSRESLYAHPQEWFESIVPEDRERVKETFAKLRDGKVTNINLEFKIIQPNGAIRNIYSRGFQMRDVQGKLLLGVASDTTDYQQTKERSEAQNMISSILNQSRDIKDVGTKILEIICNTLELDMGNIWLCDPKKNVIRCVDVWSKNTLQMESLIRKSFEASFKKGEGIPGVVWKNKKSLLVSDLPAALHFPCASMATKVGLQSAFASPIIYNKKVYGVMEFFSSRVQQADPESFTMVEHISEQLAEFIHLKYTEEQLNHISRHDILTGLMNRAIFEEEITKILKFSPPLLGLIILDLDRFKLICEEMGHDAGDLLLQAVANKLSKVFSAEDEMVARLGADKFILALLNLKSIEAIKGHIKVIQDLFKEPFLIKGKDIFITASMGVSVYPEDGVDIKTLLQTTEITLSQVKEEGGNHFQFTSSSIESLISEVIQLESSLRRALLENQFCLYYQPKVDLKTGHICGLEALIRWNHPEKGLLPPGSFIGIAEQSDLIVQIGEWVLHEVCRQITSKEIFASEKVPISINLSVLQFSKRHNLTGYILKLIDNFGINPNVLELEVTEGILAKDMEKSLKLLNAIHKMDIRISLDDFGTGYSSLKYLQYFPVSSIKIDKSFVDGIPLHQQNVSLVKSIIALSHNLGKKVIAEGVETKEQLEFLIKENCDEIQGYYFSKPLPADKIKRMIGEKKYLTL